MQIFILLLMLLEKYQATIYLFQCVLNKEGTIIEGYLSNPSQFNVRNVPL